MIIFNYLLASIVWIISMLPFWILYGISDILFLFVYYIIPYRKQVVLNNLRNSFPDKSENEIRKISKKYYHNICDIILETIKGKNISLKSLMKRMNFINFDIINKYYLEKRSIIALTGHLGNWEWFGMIAKFYVKHKGFAVVKPLQSKFWDVFISKIRLRFTNEGLIPFTQTYRVLLKHRTQPTFTLIVGDQRPLENEIENWTLFLNQDTPFSKGVDKIAKSLNMVIAFIDIKRIKRGYYNVEFSVMHDEPIKTSKNEITEMYVKKLEDVILKQPESWLWSHKRWKFQRKNN